jgi:uncharacterized membrane protein YhfC
MDFHNVTYIMDILLLFAMPISLGVYFVRKFDLEASLWWVGAIIFIVTLIGHSLVDNYLILPASYSLSQSLILPSISILYIIAIMMGLNTGIWEAFFCYAMFRWWMKNTRTWLDGILIGLGMGGASAILTGFRDIYDFINNIFYRNLIATNASSAETIPPELQAEVRAFWSAPWYSAFAHIVQQFFMILILIGLVTLILQAFTRKQWFWVLFAIGFISLVVATNIILSNLANPLLAIVSMALFASVSVAFVLRLRGTDVRQVAVLQPGSLMATHYRMKTPKTVDETLAELRKGEDK